MDYLGMNFRPNSSGAELPLSTTESQPPDLTIVSDNSSSAENSLLLFRNIHRLQPEEMVSETMIIHDENYNSSSFIVNNTWDLQYVTGEDDLPLTTFLFHSDFYFLFILAVAFIVLFTWCLIFLLVKWLRSRGRSGKPDRARMESISSGAPLIGGQKQGKSVFTGFENEDAANQLETGTLPRRVSTNQSYPTPGFAAPPLGGFWGGLP